MNFFEFLFGITMKIQDTSFNICIFAVQKEEFENQIQKDLTSILDESWVKNICDQS